MRKKAYKIAQLFLHMYSKQEKIETVNPIYEIVISRRKYYVELNGIDKVVFYYKNQEVEISKGYFTHKNANMEDFQLLFELLTEEIIEKVIQEEKVKIGMEKPKRKKIVVDGYFISEPPEIKRKRSKEEQIQLLLELRNDQLILAKLFEDKKYEYKSQQY